ncbi:MAG: hypothetical protein HOF84_15635, partial [Rhodospirillales bacterium]|nr:hypothetical protein [Rhodospirillales bacterium]
KPLSLISEMPDIEQHNPLGRVPALILDDGRTLIDSAAILDHIDALVGPDRALLPMNAPTRQLVLQLVAYATGTLERVMNAVAEENRPVEKQIAERTSRFDRQSAVGLSALENIVQSWEWSVGERLTQSEIISTITTTYIQRMRPHLWDGAIYPTLATITSKCENLPAFRDAPFDVS